MSIHNVPPPKLLSCNMTLNATTPIASYWTGTVTTDLKGKARSWNVIVSVNTQFHSSVENSGVYDGRDVNVGDYITTEGGAKFLRILAISSQNLGQVICEVEDEDKLNALLDETQAGDGFTETTDGFIFEVKNNMPVLYPLPAVLPAQFTRGFAGEIISRFMQRGKHDTYHAMQASHNLSEGRAVCLKTNGEFEMIDYTSTSSNKQVFGIVEEIHYPEPDNVRIRTVGPVIDVNLTTGTAGSVFYIDRASSTGQLTTTQPSMQSLPIYIKIDNTRAVFMASGLDEAINNVTGSYTVADMTALLAIASMDAGDTAFVLDTGSPEGAGEWGYFVYDGTNWKMISAEDGAGVDAKSHKQLVSWNSASQTVIHKVSHNVRVLNVSVEVMTLFNGLGATITVGDGANNIRFMEVTENDLYSDGKYYSFPNHLYNEATEQDVIAFLDPGTASQGSAEVLITYV